jgi:hypothetical protein
MKINNYLLTVFIILVFLNVLFYFFGNSLFGWLFYAKEKTLAQGSGTCPGFNQCPGSQNCDGGGGGGGGSGNLLISSIKILTFACETSNLDWNNTPPWSTYQNPPSRTDFKENLFQGGVHGCPISNTGEPIVVQVTSSSTEDSSLTITLSNGGLSTSSTHNLGRGEHTTSSMFIFSDNDRRNRGTWQVEAQLCTQGGGNCVAASTSVKIYDYKCLSGSCKYYSSPSSGARETNNEYCKFWIGKYCGAESR